VETSEWTKRLSLAGDGVERMTAARSALLQLVDECRESVSTYSLQGQDTDTCADVTENLSLVLDDAESALVDVRPAAGVIRLTGTKDEINRAFGLLEVLGVPLSMPSSEPPAQTGATVAEPDVEPPPPSLQLWAVQDADTAEEDDDNIYAPKRGGDSPPEPVVVDAKLWKYMQKSNGQWAGEITDVREKMGIVISESVTGDGAVTLSLTGVDDDVVESTERMRQLVKRCRDAVRTVDVVCTDSTVHAKVLRFLALVNKVPAYVAVESDERLTATGTPDELDECADKLARLGASLAREDHTSSKGGSGEDGAKAGSGDNPLPTTPLPDVNGTRGSPTDQNLELDERLARQLQEAEDADRRGQSVSTRVPGGGGDEDRQYGEIPVPIEEVLWSFVEKRRAAQLQQLREAYVVKISTHRAAQEGFVVIAMQAESALMLECAQEELGQLLENLRANVIVQVLSAVTIGIVNNI